MAKQYPVCKDDGEMFGPQEVWERVDELGAVHREGDSGRETGQRRGWKTVRIFVSSTFTDFHYERDVLVKEVFPDLRKWCQENKLHLVECDLRWGAPKNFNDEDKMKLCLDEIKRCYHDNHQKPFFLNMISKRTGWIPKPKETKVENQINFDLLRKFNLVFGLSITEMEIVYGAYSITNPNALFLIRDNSFFGTLPADEKLRKRFYDHEYEALATEKITLLKEKLGQKFHEKKEAQFVEYSAKFSRYADNEKKNVKFQIKDEEKFCEQILQFFRRQIRQMYPPIEEVDHDPFTARRLDHEAFMGAKAQDVLGREDTLTEISKHIRGMNGDVPLLLLGKPGIGKSSIMAKAAMDAESTKSAILGGGKDGWQVFYHFVGAVPGSTELRILLHRILNVVTDTEATEMPSGMEECVATTNSALDKDSCPHTIIFIDALNQLDEDHPSVGLVNWLPKKLGDRVRCVLAMVPECEQHKTLMTRESQPKELEVSDLTDTARQKIVEQFLARYNKILGKDQMRCLLSKRSAVNPLWLTIGCEELRVHGSFTTVTDKIKGLEDDLNGLLGQVLSRFEDEGDTELMKASLCLIEVSKRGLLETELIYILGDLYFNRLTGLKKSGQAGYSDDRRLPALQWTRVTRALGSFLRPYGGLNEGRLDFYHRTVSKAVRSKYLQEDKNGNGKLEWHLKLSHFFEHCSLPLERRVEEYPYHLVCLKNSDKLKVFLSDWRVFDILYDREFSIQLLDYWKHCGGLKKMAATYTKLMRGVRKDQKVTKYEQVGRVCLQGGQYDESLKLAESGLDLVKTDEDLMSLAAFYTLLTDIYNHKLYGQYLMVHAYNHRMWAETEQDNHKLADEVSRTGLKFIEEVIKIFEKLGERGLLAEAFMTRGVLYRGISESFGLQIKSLKQAMDLCKEVYGDTHLLMPRILRNLGNAYNSEGKYEEAFDMYVKCIHLYNLLFGASHPKTKANCDVIDCLFYSSRYGTVQLEGSNTYVLSVDQTTKTLVK